MRVQDVKARKEHVCDVCNEPIKKGEIYTMITSEPYDWDWEVLAELSHGPYQTFHRHKKCYTSWEMLRDYADDEYIGEVYEGGIYDLIPDIFSEYTESLILYDLDGLYSMLHSGKKEKDAVIDGFRNKGYSMEDINNFIDFIEFLNKMVKHKEGD
ncbi:MAG: hypothetical protein ACP5RE_03565 [Candidatus Acidifodinimicrobium sp.]